MRGISDDGVPFQLSHDGTHDHQWKPDWRMTGVMAAEMPAHAAAAGRRMPNRTTVASHSNPVAAGVVELLMLVWNDAYMIPPTAAMAADRANRASFTRSGETPDVDAAISDDRTAAMLRPHGERLRLFINNITSRTTMSSEMAIVRLLARLNAPILSRGMVQPSEVFRNQFHWNKTLSPRRARARVASARGRPPRRRAGRATIMPSSTVTRMPRAAAP